MMKINAVEQTVSAIWKFANGILKMPSEPKIMPRRMNTKRAGIPSCEDSLFPRMQEKMTMAAIKSVIEMGTNSCLLILCHINKII